MIEVLQHNFKEAISFSNDLASEKQKNFKELFTFLSGFKEIYNKEEKKLPYHINLIDELRAGENAHSRILVKLLQKHEVTSEKYEILESFLRFIIEKNPQKEHFNEIKVKDPIITQETKRIDLWIRDSNYAIIIENKVTNAIDQNDGIKVKGGQLERYINTTKEEFKEEQIYVLYLPPTYEKEPSLQTWGKYYESDICKKRYLNISFKDDILPWLKHNVLPNIRLKDKYLSSAIEQYIDHLEGKFSLRTINNNMNMELQEFIKKELGLNGVEPEEALKKIENKEKEMQDALNQTSELKEKIKIEHFPKWAKLLSIDFPDYEIVGNWTKPDNFVNIGVKYKLENTNFSLMIEYKNDSKKIYYGIGMHYATTTKESLSNFEEIISNLDLTTDFEWWYGWTYTSFEEAYISLKALIDMVEKSH